MKIDDVLVSGCEILSYLPICFLKYRFAMNGLHGIGFQSGSIESDSSESYSAEFSYSQDA